MRKLKRYGFSDAYIAASGWRGQVCVRDHRKSWASTANFYRVDTCAAEFEGVTPYLYSTYEMEDESAPSAQPRAR